MDTATSRPTVFVSYNQADRQWAEWIAWTLEEAGHRIVIQAWDFRPGSNFVLEMHKAAAGTDKTLAVLSDHYLQASFTQPEWASAFAKDPQGRERKLVPVRVAECCPAGLLGPIVWVDLVGLSEEAAHDRLLQAFSERGKPLHAPAFPSAPPLSRVAPTAVPFPGDPPLHNLPYTRLGDLFTGRQEELDALVDGGTAAITQSAAISGLGGIGKTRLALEYAWRSGNRYTAAWFVRADSLENLRRNLAALAGPELLNLPEWGAQVEDKTVAAVKRWLREHPGWLIILDNADTPEAADAVLEILPSLSKGRVLITSRLGSWPAGIRKQSLDKLSHEEAVRFLLHRTGSGREPMADDDARAADLAERVDGLPLALEQAAAYIIRHRMRFTEYLRAWEQEHDKLLQWYDPRVMQYPASVAVTWKQTFDRLSPTAAALLRLIAFLAPDPIPFEMLEQGAEHVKKAAELFCDEAGTAADGKTVREATADLADYSLISRQDGGMLVVHRMVQEALRSQIPEAHRRDWIEGALRIVNAAAVGNPSDVRTWPVWDRLRSHVAEVVARADEMGFVDPTSRLLGELGVLLWAKGLYSEAEPVIRRALSLFETSLEPEKDRVSIALHNLALLLQETNRSEEAEPLIRRALDIDEASFGKDHPRVADQLNNLAMLLQRTDRLEKAEPLMRRALDIDEASFGNEHPKVARDLNNLAWLLESANRLEEAEPLIRRALAIDEASFGNNHPTVANRLHNLARLLKNTNRPGEAEPLMRRALAIDEASFGNKHPYVARDLNSLAKLLQDTNRLEEAEPLMRRALAIDEVTFGNEHPKVAALLNNLALLLQDTNRLEEAEPLLRRALAIDEASFGNNHPEVARDLNYLALLLQDTNRLEEAEPLLRRALAIDESLFGNEHPSVSRDLNNLAHSLQATNRLGEAEPLMRRALAIDETFFGSQHPRVATRLDNLAGLLQATNRLGEAEPLIRRALAIDEASFGNQHPNIAIRLNNLAGLLHGSNRLGEAEPLMRRAVEILEESVGPEHPRTQAARTSLECLLAEIATAAGDDRRRASLAIRTADAATRFSITCEPARFSVTMPAMAEKRITYSLAVPGAKGTSFALRLPGRGSFPGVDDHLVEPEVTRDEIINGRRVVAMPADAPHGDKQASLDVLLGLHVSPGYITSVDLLTRFTADSDFASDTCVRRDGIDPETGRRHLEEIAFEVVSTQNERKVTEKAEVMQRRGVRRIFGIWVKGRRRVCEWSAESGSWLPLDAESRIEDPCLATPLAVAALLYAALVRKAVVQALVAQGDPEIQKLQAEAKAEGEAIALLKFLEARGITVSVAQRQEILACRDPDRLDRWLRGATRASSAAELLSES